MKEKIIKELIGHSGSKVFLMADKEKIFVRKSGDVSRNFERLNSLLQENYPVPFIYDKSKNKLDLEYINGIDIVQYLTVENITSLSSFIIDILKKFAGNHKIKDYTKIYSKKLFWIDQVDDLPFTKDELLEFLPKNLPSSNYHGDLTLENILYSNGSFYMIDPVTTEYDSYVFDIAKLRQDLECKWFLRNSDFKYDLQLQNLQDTLKTEFSYASNNYLLILMLLRVYLHTKPIDNNRKFIIKEINRLWK